MHDFGLHDHGVLEKNLNGFMAHIGASHFRSATITWSCSPGVRVADVIECTGIRFLLVPVSPTDAAQTGGGAVLMPVSAK